ncbi:flagellar hook-length control protein FliK [Photobacterium atrarenae]|uniref:Flagellar hook-length control protein FliK n=1 Tax=Photobacterium atrarenae TaxID=865757 RepID=A0ABY5GE76_9GAMM|nr:flagellar hook-length control protein FliK [Photobacterium atrarenae]UTV27024.1 flagellar hook-length control protein FliK [Photobacterium atrarenae]
MFSSRLFSAESTPPAAPMGGSHASLKTATQGQGAETAEEGKFADAFQSVTTSRDSQATDAQKGVDPSAAKLAEAAPSATASDMAGDEKSAQPAKVSGDASVQAEIEPAAGEQGSEEVIALETDGEQLDTMAMGQPAPSSAPRPSDENLSSRQNNGENGLDPSHKRQIMDDGEALLSRLAAAEKQLAGGKSQQADGLAAPEVGKEHARAGKELPLSSAGGMPRAVAMQGHEAVEPSAGSAQGLVQAQAKVTDGQSGQGGEVGRSAALESSGPGHTGSASVVSQALIQKEAVDEKAADEHHLVRPFVTEQTQVDDIQLDDTQLAALAKLSGQGQAAQGALINADSALEQPALGGKSVQVLSPEHAEWLQAVAQKVKSAAGVQSVDGGAKIAPPMPGAPQALAEAVSGSLGTSSMGTGALGSGILSAAATIPQHSAAAMPGLIAATGEGAAVDASHAAMNKVQAEALTAGTLAQGVLPHGAEGSEGRGAEVAQAVTSLNQQQGINASPIRAEAAQAQTPLMLSKEQAGEQLAERVQVMVAKNLKHVDIRLDPPELGRLQIKLSLNQDQASVQFHVGNAQTRELVEQAMPRLRELMNQQGLQLAQSSVQQDSGRQQFAGQSGQQQQTNTGQSGSDQSGGQQGHAGRHAQQTDGESLEMYVSQPTDRVDYYA